jgi:NAD(P)-dependent dehydrogenase (short-subunit alcohol dehydrogenase family)
VGRLEGKVVILTGAGAGIAKATALACVREGAKVALFELNEESGASAEKQIRVAHCLSIPMSPATTACAMRSRKPSNSLAGWM